MARAEPRPAGVIDAQSALGFLAQASGVLAQSLDYERTLADVARLAVPDFADWCAIDIIQPDGSLRQVTSIHPNPELEQLLIDLRALYRAEKGGSEGVQRVVRTGQPELFADVTGTARARLQIPEEAMAKYEQLSPRSYIIVPLVARARTIGALTLLSTREERYYNESDLDFAMHLGRRFALAVDNSRLYDEAERARSELDSLFASVPVGLALFDRELRCVRVNAAIAEIAGHSVDYYVGRTAAEVSGVNGAEVTELYSKVLATRQPVVDHEMSGESPLEPGRRRHWLLSVAPIVPPGREPVGVGVAVTDVTERRALLERERADRRRAAFLARVGEILESSLDYATTLRNLTQLAVPELADWCAVHMLDDAGALRLMAVAHSDPEKERLAWELEERFPPDPSAPTGAMNVVRTGATEVFNDITGEMILESEDLEGEHAQILAGLGLRASVTAPLRARGRTLGTVTLVAAESKARFDSDDVELVEELARRFGLAADNARLYTERTHIAHTLQSELLPSRLPAIPGARVAVRYRAAGELNEVGGDFYDVFERRDGDWAFVIGDVSGKGAEAAAVTALARHTVRTASLQPASPSSLLATLNDALLAQRAGSEFCTVCVARLHRNGGDAQLSVALGGHPPALVLRRDGTVERLGAPGTLLGVFDDPRLEEASAALAPGDTVLFYTDGVTEAGPTGAEIGEDGLAELLGRLGGCSPEQVVDAVERAAVAAQEGTPRDDIALVAFQVS